MPRLVLLLTIKKCFSSHISLWAEARNKGLPTADDLSLDADVIICAQYQLLAEKYPGRYVVIATTNIKHLSRFTEVKEWQNIKF
ncbi:MAG: hypothetical protein QNJ55_36680 [Xenococcus sp. MO_188.B8]|nr:hypothetical protein [Xenococcus sp. MO_188.B8]